MGLCGHVYGLMSRLCVWLHSKAQESFCSDAHFGYTDGAVDRTSVFLFRLSFTAFQFLASAYVCDYNGQQRQRVSLPRETTQNQTYL